MPQGLLPRGTRVRIIYGRYAGRAGTVEANVFQKSVDYPEEFAMGCQVVLDDGRWVTVKRDQVKTVSAVSLIV